MKRLFKTVLSLLVGAMILMLPSCAGQDDAKVGEIKEKIERHESLTQKDYGVMLDYLNEYMEQALKIIEMGGDENDTKALEEEFPDAAAFINTISLNEEKLDADNKKKAEKIGELFKKILEESMKQAQKKYGTGAVPAE